MTDKQRISQQPASDDPPRTTDGSSANDEARTPKSTAGDYSTDAELLRRAAHDPAAFRVVYDRHSYVIYKFVLRRVRDHEAAIEVTAETFARAWLGHRKFTDRRSGTALPWLYGIASNVIRESVRRQRLANRATQRLGLTLGIDHGISPAPSWSEGLDEDLDAALQRLPTEQRRAVEMRILHDGSYATLAEELDCSEGAARIRVSRGLRALRRVFRGEQE